MTKLFAGIEPKKNEGWIRVGLLNIYGLEWAIFENEISSKYPWINIKVILSYGLSEKGNYIFAYNKEQKRFSRSKDLDIMIEHKKEIYENLCLFYGVDKKEMTA